MYVNVPMHIERELKGMHALLFLLYRDPLYEHETADTLDLMDEDTIVI